MTWEKVKASTEVYGTGPVASDNSQNSQKKLKNKSCNLSIQTAQRASLYNTIHKNQETNVYISTQSAFHSDVVAA